MAVIINSTQFMPNYTVTPAKTEQTTKPLESNFSSFQKGLTEAIKSGGIEAGTTFTKNWITTNSKSLTDCVSSFEKYNSRKGDWHTWNIQIAEAFLGGTKVTTAQAKIVVEAIQSIIGIKSLDGKFGTNSKDALVAYLTQQTPEQPESITSTPEPKPYFATTLVPQALPEDIKEETMPEEPTVSENEPTVSDKPTEITEIDFETTLQKKAEHLLKKVLPSLTNYKASDWQEWNSIIAIELLESSLETIEPETAKAIVENLQKFLIDKGYIQLKEDDSNFGKFGPNLKLALTSYLRHITNKPNENVEKRQTGSFNQTVFYDSILKMLGDTLIPFKDTNNNGIKDKKEQFLTKEELLINQQNFKALYFITANVNKVLQERYGKDFNKLFVSDLYGIINAEALLNDGKICLNGSHNCGEYGFLPLPSDPNVMKEFTGLNIIKKEDYDKEPISAFRKNIIAFALYVGEIKNNPAFKMNSTFNLPIAQTNTLSSLYLLQAVAQGWFIIDKHHYPNKGTPHSKETLIKMLLEASNIKGKPKLNQIQSGTGYVNTGTLQMRENNIKEGLNWCYTVAKQIQGK